MITPKDIAIECAKEAGAFIKSSYLKHQSQRVTFKEHNEPVTQADMTSHEIIIDRLSKAFPSHKIISEESFKAEQIKIGDGPTWVIDPLDGTTNFMANIPLFCITIAFFEKKELLLGLIFEPLFGDLYLAQKNKGATLNGKSIKVSSDETRGTCVLLAGRGYRQSDKNRHAKIIYNLERKSTYFRRLGCAALMLAHVACGHARAVILTGSQSWDIAAGALLVREAGGLVTDYQGDAWNQESPDIVASNGYYHDQILQATKKKHSSKLCS